jgi:membrane-bound metal-dependent hydrolase YbcI (DUF457 family)
MPTPIGHSLAGYAAARLTRVQLGSNERRLFVIAAAFGILPDVLGQITERFEGAAQHGFSHSIAAMLLVSLLAAAVAWRAGWRFWPVLLFVGAAYGSHLVADLLRPPMGPTSGEQLFWPLPPRYAIDLNILPHVPARRLIRSPAGLAVMSAFVLREVLVLAPIAFACHFIRPTVAANPRAAGRARAKRTAA